MVNLGRLFHLPDQKGFLADLESRIAQDGPRPLGADEVKALGAAHRLSAEASAKAATSFTEAMVKTISLADFKAGKADQIKSFAVSLGVSATTIDAEITVRAKAVFGEWAAAIVKTGTVTNADWDEMRDVGRALGLDEPLQNQLYGAAAQGAVLAMAVAAIADDMLSPAEDAELLKAISVKYRIKPDFAGAIGQQMDHAREHWAVAKGALPVVAVPLSLQRGETAHAVLSATAYQTATRTKSVGYGGPALRIRIAKGLYYRTGHYRVHRETEKYENALGRGSLVVTNKRLLFIAPDRTSSARLDSILHIEPFTNALAVVRSSGKRTTYRFDKAGEWFCAILARAIHDATA